MENKRKYKLVKTGKKLLAVGLSLTLVTGTAIAGIVHSYSTGSSSEPSINQTYVDSDDKYLDIEHSNEKRAIVADKISTNIGIDNKEYKEIINVLESYNYEFSMSEYYDLENTLEIYNNTLYQKKKDTSIISNGQLDLYKLYNTVISNNNAYMNQDVNAINSFLSQASKTEILNICNLIIETYNKNPEIYGDIEYISDTLSHLKIFKFPTSPESAAVSDKDFILTFNPEMIKKFTNMQVFRNNTDDDVDVSKTIFVHETEHLLQKASNDFNYENGIETGFCRIYDKTNVNSLNVNSLWYSWLLEGSAELKMTETLSATPKLYDIKISYIRSYNLSRIFEDSYDVNDLVNSAFVNDLDSMFKKLNINDKDSRMEFLKLMYSIQITQYDVDDFWKFYEKQEGITLTKEEKESIRMDIRTEAVKNLSSKYYKGLAKALKEGKIKDLETLFYLMRLWELDCCGHLNFANEAEYEHAKDFIIWQDNVEKSFISAISNSNNMSYDELISKYDNYHMLLDVDGNIINNADFSNLSKEKQEYISNLYEKYSVTYFTRTSTMANYINNNEKRPNGKN